MVWDEEGRASIVTGTLTLFWELVADQACTIGLLNVCLVDLCGGMAMACPLVDLSNPCTLPEASSDLTPMDRTTLMEQAHSNPREDSSTYEDVGMDGEWAVWFGWRFAHMWCGEPWVRRFHIFGCPLRNVPMGQVRKVKVPKDLPSSSQVEDRSGALPQATLWETSFAIAWAERRRGLPCVSGLVSRLRVSCVCHAQPAVMTNAFFFL